MADPFDEQQHPARIDPADVESAELEVSHHEPADRDSAKYPGAPRPVEEDWRNGEYSNDSFNPPSGKKNSCLLIGCATIFIGGFFMILCTGFGAYRLYMKQIEKYTSAEALDLPTVEYDEEQLTELEGRIAKFKAKMESDQQEPAIDSPRDQANEASSDNTSSSGMTSSDATPNEGANTPTTGISVAPSPPTTDSDPSLGNELELRLTADDINALIAQEKKLHKKIFVKIENGKITGDLSFPLDGMIPKAEGRFLNGEATLQVRLRDGELSIRLENLKVNGEELPDHLVSDLKNNNFAKDVMKDPDAKKWIGQFDKVEVDGDELVVILKPVASESASD